MPASELDTLRQYLAFSSIRGPHPSVGGPLSNGLEVGGTEPPANVQRAFARHGELFQGKAVKVLSAAQDSTSKAGARYHTTKGQVPSEEVFRVLKFNHSRPIWSASVWSAMLELQAAGTTLSPSDYPHAAEDIIAAVLHFLPFTRTAPREPLSLSGDQPGVESSRLRVAVWSAISPWVECTIMFGTLPSQLPCFANASLTTVDYNEPIVPELATSPHAGSTSSTTRLAHEPWRARFRTLDQSSLAHHYAAGERFDVIVSFSGIEHDGLGRYGDPLNPEGDFAAMRELHHFLAPHGRLLLGIPTGIVDDIEYPWHRIYGPIRTRALLEATGWQLLGRAWNGSVVHGGFETAEARPPLFPSRPHGPRWQHQPVLALGRKGENGRIN